MTAAFRRAAARVLLDKLKLRDSSVEGDGLTKSIQWVPDLLQKRVVVQLPVESLGVIDNKTAPKGKMREPAACKEQEFQHIKWIHQGESDHLSFSIPMEQFCKHIVDNINLFPNAFWESSSPNHRQHVVIEYSSPNLAKPFHFGHLRSTIIGNFVANLHETLGHKVTRLNYLGDWGTQYGLLGTGLNSVKEENGLEEKTIDHLLQVYVRTSVLAEKDPSIFDQAKDHFRLMEEGHPDVLDQWKRIRELSIKYLRNTYKRLGVHFDEYHAESMYRKGAMDVVSKCKELGILSNCNGALGVESETDKSNTMILCKRDGTSVYLSRDIAAAIDRKNRYNFHKMHYVVDVGQTDHFMSMFRILKQMGLEWHNTLDHLKFGRVSGMSTRKGEGVLLHDVINEAQKRMLQTMKESPNTRVHDSQEVVAENLGLSTLIVNDLQKLRQRTYNFCWDEVIKLKGNLGVQLQYTHARLCSLLDLYEDQLNLHAYDSSWTTEVPSIHLIECLSRYDDVLNSSCQQLQACILVKYLLELRSLTNSALRVLAVKGQPEEMTTARLCIFNASRTVLNHGMKILGLHPLRQM